MKFMYVDESGLHDEVPYLVFFGFLVDDYRLKKTIERAGDTEAWPGEHAFFHEVVSSFSNRLAFPSKTWVPKPISPSAKWIRDVGFPDLNKWVSSQCIS